MALLPAISLDFRHRETVNANGGQGVTNFFELEWLDDGHNNFHRSYPPLGPGPDATGRSRLRFTTRREITQRAQPAPLESNAVPDRPQPLTDYERGAFCALRESASGAPFRRAQSLVTIAQNLGATGSRHNPA